MPALALTDHGTMYGIVEFYQKCKKNKIKPIIGLEGYLCSGDMHVKDVNIQERRYHVILLAKDWNGYQNLVKLTTIAHLEGFYYKPRFDWRALEKHKDGLICLSACLQGEIPSVAKTGNYERTENIIKKYMDFFGKDNFYLEVQPHPSMPEQIRANQVILELGKKLKVDVVATNDVHYLNSEDDEAQDVLLCLQMKKKKDEPNRMTMIGEDFSFYSPEKMQNSFRDNPEVLKNTLKVAEKCNVELPLGETRLPSFKVPNGKTAEQYLEELAYAGLEKRYGKTKELNGHNIKERVDFELSVIKKTGFAPYFLIVADFTNWARSQGILVGPGRGSAAGSIVSYLIGITNIDPLPYNLLFERFLNPDRISMPDIDLDFADTRRDEVIRYVENKYGKDHVAQIITFGTMAARVAVRDVGRVLDYPYNYCDKLAKLIPAFSNLDKALEIEPELKEMYQNDEDARKIIDTAKKLEGVARHASTHACGVLITKEPLNEIVPTQHSSSGDEAIVSQYSLHPIEDMGLLKMDFLGLSNLTILENAIEVIDKIHKVKIDIDKIPLDDKKTFKLLQDGETTGVFQLESSGMKRYLKQLKPTVFEDIIAMVSLYRPGPMDWIPDYIAGKHGTKEIHYLHPKLKPILETTYGIAVYQEQVMRIAQSLAGFTLAEADVLRKAVGKKIKELLAEQKEKFINGCVKNGVMKEVAEKVFSFIEPFAGYGFNKSHGACYALIAYFTAYLKANYPAEFMASLLTSDLSNTDRIAIEVEECGRMGIEVLPPDINESYSTFTVVAASLKDKKGKTRIRFGLKAIKNVGQHIAEAIIHERKENGAYEDLEGLLERVQDKDLNKKSLESLIKCGALDGFGERNQMLHNIEKLLQYTKNIAREKENKQSNLFSTIADTEKNGGRKLSLDKIDPADKTIRLNWEKELLGLYISEHPFKEYENLLRDVVVPCSQIRDNMKHYVISVAGIITKVHKIYTKNNEIMFFVKIEDTTGSTEIIVFPSILRETSEVWQEGNTVIVNGKPNDKDGEVKVLCNKAAVINNENIGEVIEKFSKIESNGTNNRYNKKIVRIHINGNFDNSIANNLKVILSKYTGSQEVVLIIQNGQKVKKIKANYQVSFNFKLKKDIESLIGPNSVDLA